MHVFNLVSPFEITLNMKIHVIVLFNCCLIILSIQRVFTGYHW